MSFTFLPSELGKWDVEKVPDALVLPFFSDERPLRGAAGLCDWRLCGRLSRLLQSERVAGKFGETTLYPPNSGGVARLPFARLVLFGLGDQARFDEAQAKSAARGILAVVARMKLQRYALVPPGRSTGLLSARRALEIYLQEDAGRGAELVVVESTAGQKEAADLARK